MYLTGRIGRFFVYVLCVLLGFGISNINISITQFRNVYTHKEVEPTQTFPSPLPEKKELKKTVKNVRILCWILTQPDSFSKTDAVNGTWGKRCDRLLFMSSTMDERQEVISLHVQEGRQSLWGKTKAAFQYVYHHHRDDADWFLKADDDTYVIVENMRAMLSEHDSSDLVYYGARFNKYVKQGYMSGGAGYVLSKAALKKLVKFGLMNGTKCHSGIYGTEDIEMGQCLENLGVKAGVSNDDAGRLRFIGLGLEHVVHPGAPSSWFWNYTDYIGKPGLNCCSSNVISFHYAEPSDMYVFEYLLYYVNVLHEYEASTGTTS